MNISQAQFHHLLWPFNNLPDTYLVVDTETTGLPDEEGMPGIVSLGLAEVQKGRAVVTREYFMKPHRVMTEEATTINGISQAQANDFPSLHSQWQEIQSYFIGNLIVFHNAVFDWSVILDNLQRERLQVPKVKGVFCSQRAAQPWAEATGLKCSARGPSLNTLTVASGATNYRADNDGQHGALIDAMQTVEVVEKLRLLAQGVS